MKPCFPFIILKPSLIFRFPLSQTAFQNILPLFLQHNLLHKSRALPFLLLLLQPCCHLLCSSPLLVMTFLLLQTVLHLLLMPLILPFLLSPRFSENHPDSTNLLDIYRTITSLHVTLAVSQAHITLTIRQAYIISALKKSR